MTEIVPILCYIVAAIFFLLWFLGRKKSNDNLALFEDAATKYQLVKKKLSEIEGRSKGNDKAHEKYQQQIKKLEKEVENQQAKFSEFKQESESAYEELQTNLVKIERQRDHQAELNEAITAQLAEAVREKKQQADELAKIQKEGAKMASGELEAMQSRYAEIQKELNKGLKANQNLKKSNDRLREILKKVDPSETKKLKAKQRSQEQLFRSIKNLREMADERNQNWETAIRLLAAHVMGQSDLQQGQPIGPLLGAALEKIGSTLVIDEHTVGDMKSTEKAPEPDPVEAAESANGADESSKENSEAIPAVAEAAVTSPSQENPS